MIRFKSKNAKPGRTWRTLLGGLMMAIPICLAGWSGAQDVENQAPSAPRPGHLIRVPLPITSEVATSIEQALQQLLDESDNVVRNEDRLTVVLEFDTANNKTGRGSQLGSCLELARKMTSNEMNRLRTIAFIPTARGAKFLDDFEVEEPKSDVMGHAVLVALAANELVVSSQASIGQATVDEEKVTNLVREVYREIALRRLTLPAPVVNSMVDADAELYRVNTDNGILYVDGKQLADLESRGQAIETTTLSTAGELARLQGGELDRFGLTRISAESRKDLALALNLQQASLENDPSIGKGWNAVEIRISNNTDQELVDWTIRAIDKQVSKKTANLFVLRVDSEVSDVDACLRLARHLASMDSSEVRTVAFVEGYAKGGAGVIAMTCDHLLMKRESTLGGLFEPPLEDPFRADALEVVDSIARQRSKDTAVAMAMIDPKIDVLRYRQVQTGRVGLLTSDQHDELPMPQDWVLLGTLNTLEGIPADTAEQLGIARRVINDFDQLKTFYQLQEDPKSIEPTTTDRWVKRVATWLASPFITPWLLFGAVFFISTEMSAPGIGVPGFLGALCLLLFFWSQHLDGNADWLEMLLFVIGAIFILIELMILPGFGVFGLGGIMMVLASLVLASQTFIIPVNSDEFRHLAYSSLTLVGACAGFGAAMFALRNVLPHAPILKQVMLQPPKTQSLGFEVDSDPESVVHWKHLEGRTGETVTPLVPAGKAKINGRLFDVISDGQLIDKGMKILVVEVTGNRILVQASGKEV